MLASLVVAASSTLRVCGVLYAAGGCGVLYAACVVDFVLSRFTLHLPNAQKVRHMLPWTRDHLCPSVKKIELLSNV